MTNDVSFLAPLDQTAQSYAEILPVPFVASMNGTAHSRACLIYREDRGHDSSCADCRTLIEYVIDQAKGTTP